MTPDTASLGQLTVVRARNAEVVRVGEAWAERPAVLVWLRHFG
jgi:hypothetical protein